jgi:hypothetical protein
MKNDGGPAFPIPSRQQGMYPGPEGMALRDYFAAKAMQGMISMSGTEVAQLCGTSRLSEAAYVIADAMLKARDE